MRCKAREATLVKVLFNTVCDGELEPRSGVEHVLSLVQVLTAFPFLRRYDRTTRVRLIVKDLRRGVKPLSHLSINIEIVSFFNMITNKRTSYGFRPCMDRRSIQRCHS